MLIFILGMWAGGMLPVAIELYDGRGETHWTGEAADWFAAFWTLALWPVTFLWFARDVINDMRR